MGLRRSKILAHIRCHMTDAKMAVKSGVHGVNIYMATSAALVKHSHGKSIDEVIEEAGKVINFVKEHNLEVRFSCEDAFRSDLNHILRVYKGIILWN